MTGFLSYGISSEEAPEAPTNASALGPWAKKSAPSGFRTPDPLIKSQLLYQLS